MLFSPTFPQDEEKEGSESTTQSGRKVRRVRQVLHEYKKGMYVHTLATLFDFIFFGCFGNVYWFSDTFGNSMIIQLTTDQLVIL